MGFVIATVGLLILIGIKYDSTPKSKTADKASQPDQRTDEKISRVNEQEVRRFGQRIAVDQPANIAKVEIVKVRLTEGKTANGKDAQVVFVDWKNVGNHTIRKVKAKIVAYSSDGSEIAWAGGEHCIYISDQDQPGVLPGEIHEMPYESRKYLATIGGPRAHQVSVTITEVSDQGLDWSNFKN